MPEEDHASDRDLRAISERITRQIETQERERGETTDSILNRITSLEKTLEKQIASAGGVPLREHVEAVQEESKRALEMAEREREKAAVALREQTQKALDKADAEREKAAAALRNESQRASDKADSEREKAAKALRQELARNIEEGDRNLRDHIIAQVGQIREALISVEKLDLQRHLTGDQKIEAVARELQIKSDASTEAIAVASVANEKRFESVNEFRDQLAQIIQTFMPREVAEKEIQQIGQRLTRIEDLIATQAGAREARQEQRQQLQPWMIWAAGALLIIAVFAANLLTGSP